VPIIFLFLIKLHVLGTAARRARAKYISFLCKNKKLSYKEDLDFKLKSGLCVLLQLFILVFILFLLRDFMDATKQQYLSVMGIEIWQTKAGVSASSNSIVDSEIIPISINHDTSWNVLHEKTSTCSLCGLCKTHTNVVFGVGNQQADIMLIGEAPGANEDLQGEPFVGRAGMLLNEMLRAIDLERKEVYIANILKCRPPNNRDPAPDEVAQCTAYLQQQITLINPKIIIAVGRIAAHFLLNSTDSMGKLRNQIHKYGAKEIPLFVIYHPAYLLRSPAEKRKAYVDMLQIRKFFREL
jgi:uracil-DNA glycosylase